MVLAIKPPFPPMEALSVDEIPVGDEWQYEPKWDGFRCLVFRNRDKVELQSKSGQPLTRYFPELVDVVLALNAKQFVLDGEIVVPDNGAFSFDALLQRIHPAQSRVRKLAAETPSLLIAFDLLVGPDGRPLIDRPLHERRRALEAFAKTYLRGHERIRLSPATTRIADAKRWLKSVGFRYNEGKPVVGSLLLGLYDDDGLLHHVGFTSSIKSEDKPALTAKLKTLVAPPRVHRQYARRPEPLVDQTIERMAAAQTQARGRSRLRSFQRRALPPRDDAVAMASGQGAAAMHVRSGEAEARKPHEIAHAGSVPFAESTAPAR